MWVATVEQHVFVLGSGRDPMHVAWHFPDSSVSQAFIKRWSKRHGPCWGGVDLRAFGMRNLSTFVFLAIIGGASAAVAQIAPEHLSHRSTFEVPANHAPVRAVATYVDSIQQTNARLTDLGAKFYGSGWTIRWDSVTGAPVRIRGEGRPFANVMRDSTAAEAAARSVLAEQLELLAPGSWLSDHELSANVLNRDIRIVAFSQQHEGLPVVNGFTAFVFKADRLVSIAGEALPNISLTSVSTPAPQWAGDQALVWINDDFNASAVVSTIGEPSILPIVTSAGAVNFHRVLPVTVTSQSPLGQWTVYVDNSGVTGRVSDLAFADGTLLYNTPEREPRADRVDYPAQQTNVTVDGVPQTSDDAGLLTFPNASASVNTAAVGPFVTINNNNMGNATTALTLNDGASVTWTGGDLDPLLDAQLTTFIHLNRSKIAARPLVPGLPWLDQVMLAEVNLTNTVCNAFSFGDNVQFFIAGEVPVNSTGETLRCANTGQLVDVIHHEFLHSFHNQTGIAAGFPGLSGGARQFSEGAADYWSATINNDPGLGPGFFLDDDGPFRPMEGPKGERYLPQDLQTGWGVHFNGGLFAASMWDLRVALISKLGEGPGKAQADKLFHAAIQRGTSMEITYDEILVEDDDDGNLANGTPNQCEIDFAFGTHGFGESRGLLGEGLELPAVERYTVSVATKTPASGCPAMGIDSMELYWQLKSDDTVNGTISMELDGAAYSATIPKQTEGQVIQYQVTTVFAGGNSRRLPLNRILNFYEFFNGHTEVVQCTDFETDPFAAGWTTNGGFQVGPPLGSVTNSDATAAYSGAAVVGTGLAEPGSPVHPDGQMSTLSAPSLDLSNVTNPRLQFRRWLNVDEALLGPLASMSINGTVLYQNAPTAAINSPAMQMDYQWRLVDVDLSSSGTSADVAFSLTGNQTLGGWNIDDFCLVSFVPSVCGDGAATGNEDCDSGMANSDTEPDACRSDCTPATCGDTIIDTGEVCDDGNTADGDLCSADCGTDLTPEPEDGGGCGCRASGGNSAGGLGLLLLLGLLIGRRRRR